MSRLSTFQSASHSALQPAPISALRSASPFPWQWTPRLNPFFILGLQLLAFWPTWRWYGLRLGDSGEEAWGAAGLAGRGHRGVQRAGSGAALEPVDRTGWAPILATCAYAVAYPILSPLPRAILALTALGCLLPCLGVRPRAALHGAGFLLMSLPAMASLQFYLGYPLRIASGETAARMINLAGFPVVRDGTLLSWRNHIVYIDAPCSGVKMLWAGMVLSLILSALRGYGPWRTAVLAAIAAGAVIVGNILRTTGLFFLETGIVQGPEWAHTGIGVFAFTAAAGIVGWAGRKSTACAT